MDSLRAAIVMSRLPRLIDPQSVWLDGLRSALRRVRAVGGSLVVAPGSAGAEFVRRGAERMEIPVTFLADVTGGCTVPPAGEGPVPVGDLALLAAARWILVLGVRTNGNMHRALRARSRAGGRIELVDLRGLQPRAVREELCRLGATLWQPSLEDQVPLQGLAVPDARPARGEAVPEIVPLPPDDEWLYLTHTTRACAEPWPGQTMPEYVDSLLDRASDADHSPVAVLQRIVTRRRLLASGRVIRGGFPVVCFTELPLPDLPKHRQYRRHRVRWDFEPFGVCIRRQWLQERGARPVIYGDNSTWLRLPESDRPFFQHAGATTPAVSRGPPSDWSAEREWRHMGDVDLRLLPAGDALVFVPGYAAATRLAGTSPWPITLWPDPKPG